MAGGASSGTASISVDANNLTTVTATTADYIIIEDVDDNTTKKALISDVVSTGDITASKYGGEQFACRWCALPAAVTFEC
jgi:hypothetical protein